LLSYLYSIKKSFAYTIIKARNSTKRVIHHKKDSIYLFILCPPYCGSTLLHRIISSSNSVSSNNYYDSREGQQLPELKNKMFVKGRWEKGFYIDWEFTKRIWHKYWDVTKTILLEKSPTNIMHIDEITKHFKPSYYIIMVRNPYAQAEGLMRRNKWGAKEAAHFVVKTFKYQEYNIQKSNKRILLIKYEDVCNKSNQTVKKINQFVNSNIPILHNIDISRNLDEMKINRISSLDISTMKEIFLEKQLLFETFDYKL